MATTPVGNGAITLRDLQNAYAEGSMKRTVLDVITKKNDMLDDLTFYQASDGDRDVTEVITGLPKAQFYLLGEGKLPSAGSRQTKSTAPARSYVMFSILRDKYNQLAQKGREEEYIRKELELQVGALGTHLIDSFLYGDRAETQNGINGLAKFYSSYGDGLGKDMDPAKRVFNGGMTGATSTHNRSIFCAVWGEQAIKPFYPEGAKDGGLNFGGDKMDDVPLTDTVNGGVVHYLQREFTWHNGLSIVDPRKCARVCNIKQDKLLTVSGYDRFLVEKIQLATTMCRVGAGEKRAIYMDNDTWAFIKVLLSRMTWANAVSVKDIMGRPTDTLFDIPVRINESQNRDEEAVVAAQ